MAELNVEAVAAEVPGAQEHMKDVTHSALCGENDEEARQAWTKILQPVPEKWRNEPYYFEDIVETKVMLRRDPGCLFVDYGDHEYQAETVFEHQFLAFLTLALERGTPFQEAWERAVRLICNENRVTQVVYELDTDDKNEVELWTERLTGLGVEPDEASGLARDATALLRQIWLTQDEGWYDEGWLTEEDQDDRRALLEKLSSSQ